MEEEIVKYLKSKSNRSASSTDIIKNLTKKISNEEYDELIENLYYQGLIMKPHEQMRSGTEPKYDFVKLSEESENI